MPTKTAIMFVTHIYNEEIERQIKKCEWKPKDLHRCMSCTRLTR